MVFVEYESEIEEERGRVTALLEKLRIEAEVGVFWLASGKLAIYDTIIQGHSDDASASAEINHVLKNEPWWDDLQRRRGKTASTDGSQDPISLANVAEYPEHDETGNRRRHSLTLLNDILKNPTVSELSRLGLSMGIHTQMLPERMFEFCSDSEDDRGSDGDTDSETSQLGGYFNGMESVASDGDLDDLEPSRRPLLALHGRRKSHGDTITPPMALRGKLPDLSAAASYGTMSSSRTLTIAEDASQDPFTRPDSVRTKTEHPSGIVSARTRSPVSVPAAAREAKSEPHSARESTTNLQRPSLALITSSSMRFSSSLVPQTKITDPEGTGPTIMFADTELTSPAKPSTSRAQSANRIPSHPARDPEVFSVDRDAYTRAVSFAEPLHTAVEEEEPGREYGIDIPDLLAQQRAAQQPRDDNDSAASYATQDLPLSFNHLPSRAQHLILNELMRQNSHDTAVLFTTLPIPEEGTCRSEAASVRYLADVEVLTHDLPPTLMILSNNMTVTVSL